MTVTLDTSDTPDTPDTPTEVRTLPMAKALNEGLRAAMAADDKVLLLGEDIGRLGGVFRVTDGLQAEFGLDRVVDTPLGESGIVGTAIGLAMRGYRPVCEIQFDGFVYPAFDQIVSQLAKLHARSQGRVRMPVVIRIPYGGGIGAVEHHSESPESYFVHTAGLKVVSCASAADAHVMIQQAIASDDPVVFFEPKRRYWDKGPLSLPHSQVTETLWQARVVQPGTDLTLLAYGPMVRTCVEAAGASEHSLEVVDLRSLSPLDMRTISASVRKTGRCVVVHEAGATLGMGAELSARLSEELFYDMEAPVLRVTGFDVPYPPARIEEHHLPGLDRVLEAVDRSLAF